MKRALIGHTGFVGGNLRQTDTFPHLYNSENIETISVESFDDIICAGVSAEMWIANHEPQKDWAKIARLFEALRSVKCSRMILISTIAVFANSSRVTEDSEIDTENGNRKLHQQSIEQMIICTDITRNDLKYRHLFIKQKRRNFIEPEV